jgi:cyanate permease
MRVMTGIDAPRKVRLAALSVFLMAPAGLLLAVDGLWELHWWSTPKAKQLLAFMARLQSERGLEPPAMLRQGGDAVLLVVLGVAGIAIGALGWWILRGRRWARTATMISAGLLLVIALFVIGADASQPRYLSNYLNFLTHDGLTDRVAQLQALLYPAWSAWAEDLAQAFQALVAAAALVALATAVISEGHYFVTRKADETADDEWDDAFSRIRQQTRRYADPN